MNLSPATFGSAYAPRADAAAQPDTVTVTTSTPPARGFIHRGAYEAASMTSQELAGWYPTLRSPDSEINPGRNRTVARTRDLRRNDGWAAGGIDGILDQAIGNHIRVVAKPDFLVLQREDARLDSVWANEFAGAAEAEFRLWGEDINRHCDTGRSMTFSEMARLALEHQLSDGDGLGVLHWLPEFTGGFGARYATTLQIIDPDRLGNPQERQDTRHFRAGVEIDDFGCPVAYHIREAHQNDFYDAPQAMRWARVERETPWGRPVVLHSFERHRADQHRGVGILTPVLARLRMLTKFDAASLQQALTQTIFGTFVESPYDAEQVRNVMEAGPSGETELSAYQDMRANLHAERPVVLNGVRVPTLAPGEKIGTVTPSHPGNNFDNFQHAMLRSYAAATGQSAEQVSKDWSRSNYSSARGAMLEAWKTLGRRKGHFTGTFNTPVYAAVLEEAMDKKRLPLPAGLTPATMPPFATWRTAYARAEWIGPGRGWVDPVKERQGEVLGLDAGFSTLREACAEISGKDYREVLAQRAVEVKMFHALGLRLPTWAGLEDANINSQKPQAT